MRLVQQLRLNSVFPFQARLPWLQAPVSERQSEERQPYFCCSLEEAAGAVHWAVFEEPWTEHLAVEPPAEEARELAFWNQALLSVWVLADEPELAPSELVEQPGPDEECLPLNLQPA